MGDHRACLSLGGRVEAIPCMLRPFFQGVLRFRWVLLLALLGMTAWFGAFVYPLDTIKYDFSFNRMFSQYGGDADALRRFNRDFGDDVGMLSVLVALPGADSGTSNSVSERVTGTVFQPVVMHEIIALIGELKSRPELEQEQVVSLAQLSNLQAESVTPDYMSAELGVLEEAAKAAGGDWTAQKAVIEAELGDAAKARPPPELVTAVDRYRVAAASMMRHKLYVGQILSPDGRTTRVLARFRLDYNSPDKRAGLIEDLKVRSRALEKAMPAGTQVFYTGLPVVERDYALITIADLAFYTPVIGLVICLFLLILFRSFLAIGVVMTPVFFATVWGIGFMQWQGEPINALNNVVPVLILVIGVAESVHILARYYQIAAQQSDKREAIIQAMCALTPACFLASFTTGIGFASLATASIPAVRGFGIFAGVAILFVFFAQITVLPIMMSLVPKPTGDLMVKREGLMAHALAWLTRLVTTRAKSIVVTAVIAAIVAVVGIALIKKDMRILHELDEDHPTAQALLETQDRIGGMLVHAVGFEGTEYPDRLCSRDADCRLADCDETECGFSGCCHTQVCRQVDRPFLLVGRLREVAMNMTDLEDLPTFELLGGAVRSARIKALSSGHKSFSPGAGSGDDIEGDDIEIDDGNDDEIEFEEEGEDNTPTAPSTVVPTKPPGICSESVKNPQLVRAIESLDDWLSMPERANVVGRASSMVDLIREMNLSFAGPDDESNYSVPKELDRETIYQLLFPLESAGGDTLSRTITRDYTRTNVTIFAYDSGAAAWHALQDDLKVKLQELFETPELAGKFNVHITGNTTLAHAALSAVVTDMITSIALAFAFIFLVISILFRSIKIGLVSMFPNLWPVLMTIAAMGYLGIELRVSSVIIFSVSLGIAVDDTIHFLHRLHEELRADDGPVDAAIERTLHGSGRAILLTTIILCMGFIAQSTSDFIAVEQFGALSALTLGVAVFGDLFVLPALVKVFKLDAAFRGHK